MLKEMKRDMASDLESPKAVTKEIVERLLSELTKGQDVPLTSVTAEQITDAIMRTVDDGALPLEKLAEFRRGVLSLFEILPRPNDTDVQ